MLAFSPSGHPGLAFLLSLVTLFAKEDCGYALPCGVVTSASSAWEGSQTFWCHTDGVTWWCPATERAGAFSESPSGVGLNPWAPSICWPSCKTPNSPLNMLCRQCSSYLGSSERAGWWPPSAKHCSTSPHDAQVPLALTSSLPWRASQPKHLHFDQFSVTEGEGKKKLYSSCKSLFFSLDQCVQLHLTSVGVLSQLKNSKWPNGKNNNASVPLLIYLVVLQIFFQQARWP